MADIPNRSAHESNLAAELFGVFQANGGASPNWDAIQQQTREKLAAAIIIIYLLMLANMDDDFDLDISETVADLEAAGYADVRSADVAAGMVDNMRAEFDGLQSLRERGQLSDAEFESRAGRIFSAERAATIATTETTRAGSAAEQRAATIAQAKDKELVAIWVCEDGPCEICARNDNEPAEVWEDEFPGGPPVHPNCRCRLAWYAASEAPVFSEN